VRQVALFGAQNRDGWGVGLTTLMDVANKEFVIAGSLDELKAKGRLVLHGGHRPILVVYDRGRVFALDNRFPRTHQRQDLLLQNSVCDQRAGIAPAAVW
jgi:hypothetical protein